MINHTYNHVLMMAETHLGILAGLVDSHCDSDSIFGSSHFDNLLLGKELLRYRQTSSLLLLFGLS